MLQATIGTTAASLTANWRVAVVGAGVSGLAAAHRLHELCAGAGRAIDLTVFESGPRAGGLVGTRSIGGYCVELGADSFITNKPWAIDLCRRLGLESRLIPTDSQYRRALVLRNGAPLPVPEGFQLLAPHSLRALFRSPILSWQGKLRVALEYLVPPRSENGDESLAQFVRRRFGQEVLDRLVQPLVGGIYTSDPERLSLRATLPRFVEMEERSGSLLRAMRKPAAGDLDAGAGASGARYGLFATLKGGIAELTQALHDRVSTFATLRFGTAVARVFPEPDGDGFFTELPDGARERFDAVVLAVPAYRAAEAIEGFAPDAATALRKIEYASTAIVVSGHRLADIRHPLDAFGLVIPAIEKRKVLSVSFTSRKFPGRAPEGCVQLRTFVGGAMQPELLARTDEELISLARDELADLLGVRWNPDFAVVARWMRSMPQYHVGHLDKVAAIERELSAFPRLALASNACYGVGLPDSIHSGEQAAARVFEANTANR